MKTEYINVKSLIYLHLFFLPLVCASQTINLKLRCQLAYESTLPNGFSNSESRDTIFEIIDNKKGVILIINRDKSFYNVDTLKLDGNIEIENLSNDNSWDIYNKRLNGNRISTTRIVIDRNTGIISYTHNANDELYIKARGNCNKVKTEQKKF